MDPALDLEARRLFVSAALTMYAGRKLRGPIPADSSAEALLALACLLAEDVNSVETRYGLSFDPPYPGVSAGVQSVAGGILRLVMACGVSEVRRGTLGVVFTTLIQHRRPQVTVAPRGARIPEGWRLLDNLP